MCGKNIIFAKNWAWKCSLFYYTWMGNSGSSSFFFLIFREDRIYLHHHEKNSNHVIAHGGVSYLLLWINVLRLHAYFYVNRFEHTCFLLIVYWARFPVKGGAFFFVLHYHINLVYLCTKTNARWRNRPNVCSGRRRTSWWTPVLRTGKISRSTYVLCVRTER